jgi:hypothetical protein
MERQDVCILINSTPKYFQMLIFQLLLLRRYAPKLHWKIFLATEALNDPRISILQTEYGV